MGVYTVGDWHVVVIAQAGRLLACSVPSRVRDEAERAQMSAERQVGRGIPDAEADVAIARLLVQLMERDDEAKVAAAWAEACNVRIATTNKVLLELRKVVPGETISYVELGRRAFGTPAARAAGTACATNPFPLIVPCHRVVKSDGSLGRFSGAGGVDTKRALLDTEARLKPAAKRRAVADDQGELE